MYEMLTYTEYIRDIISYSEDAEIRRCTIGICLCIVSSKKEEKKDNKDT